MDFYESLDQEARLGREATRSAIILAKIRYDEQLAPFVKDSRSRLASTLVRTEIERIVKECSEEVGADVEVVAKRFDQVLADVVLPVTQPEKVNVTEVADSLPPGKNSDEKPEAQATTDVKDHGAVLVDEIIEPDKKIPVQGCCRCASANDQEGPVCTDCEAHLLIEAGVTPDFLASKSAAPMVGAPNVQPNVQQTQPSAVGPQQPLTPLNPNSPYQCNVCGFTGTFHDVQAHLNAATDTNHQQAKQQQQQAGGVQQSYQPMAAADRYLDDVHKDEVVEPKLQTNPKSHFEKVVQTMANRAAARQLSAPKDDTVSAVANAYGLDPDQVRNSLFITAKFGDYVYTNGQPGEQPAPEGYVPLNLDGTQGQESGHEVVVPVTTAVRKAATDLGMDEHTVYASIKNSMGDGLSDEYHVTAKGMYTMYVPSSLLDQATNHPQPQAPDQSQQQAPSGPPSPSGAPGSPVESMQPIQPMQQQAHFLGKPLEQTYLDWLLARDEEIQSKRMARRGYLKLR